MDREALLQRIKSDTRSKEECFASLCERMRVLAVQNGGAPITDQEAEEAARRLIGFATTIVESGVERDKRESKTKASITNPDKLK